MKKTLLLVCTAIILRITSFSQNADSIWAANPQFAEAVSVNEKDIIERCGIVELISSYGNWEVSKPEYYQIDLISSPEDLKVRFVRSDSLNSYGNLSVNWGTFLEGANAGNKFGDGADTLSGYVWDATSSDVVINAEYKLEVVDPTGSGISTASIKAEVVDANGRVADAIGHGYIEIKNLDATDEWTPIEWLFGDQVYDQFSSSWWELNPEAVPVGDSIVNYREEMTYVPLNMTRIIGLNFTIDHGATSAERQPIGKEVIFHFRDLTVGTGRVICYLLDNNADDSSEPLGIYPIPASQVLNVPGHATLFTMLGEAVATGVDVVDVSELPAGMYIVTVAEGAATIIIE